MKSKFLIPVIALFAGALLFGTTYSAWVIDNTVNVDKTVQPAVQSWTFERDPDFAKIEGVSNCAYLEASAETSIVNGSLEAIRLTNTAGTQGKAHSFNLATDRDYLLDEIKVMKVEFDYYHAQKRQQAGKGFPKVTLLSNNSTTGNTQGGGDTVNSKSVFFATNINDSWWHLEYFITALCPTMVDHGDRLPYTTNTIINGIKITDDNIYDYNSNTAFIVVDNVRFSSTLSDRLGLFNKGTTFTAGGYYWMKIAWAGELHSCVMTFSNPTVAEQDLDSTKSPFYIKGLTAGTTTVTATLELGDEHQILTISNTLTVNAS